MKKSMYVEALVAFAKPQRPPMREFEDCDRIRCTPTVHELRFDYTDPFTDRAAHVKRAELTEDGEWIYSNDPV